MDRVELGRWAQEAHRQTGGLPVASRLEGEPPLHAAFLASAEEEAVGLVVVGSEKTSGLEALRRTSGNRSQAATLLGISRNGFKAKCRRLGIRLSPVP